MVVSLLGECFLAVMFLLSGFMAVLGLASLKLEPYTAKKVLTWARRAMFSAAGFSIAALISLTVAFLMDNFSIAAVGQYSSVNLPFFYKLSAVWAGSAGSLLLWSTAIFVVFALWLTNSDQGNIKVDAVALSIGSAVCLGFSVLLVFIEKPFASSLIAIDDGAGLNPLLQNLWMIIHPPLLFIGYSAFLIPFVAVCASVLTNRVIDAYIYSRLRQWMLFGICFLTLGIATGARWSYVELGWGGYWAWDPVENASLLPWLLAVAALHSVVGMPLTDKFKHCAIVLAPLPFILSLVATFITRSGILQSVHSYSFGENVVFSALLAFIGCCFLLWLVCAIKAVKSAFVTPSRPRASGLDKAEILFWADIIFIFAAVVIAIATFWPVLWRFCADSNFTITPTRRFYDRMISPVSILLAFLIGLAALADLQKRSHFIAKLLGCCAAGLLCFGLVFKLSPATALIALACAISAFSFTAILMKLVLNLKAASKIAGNVAHLGILVLVVAAGFASVEQAVQAQLTRKDEIAFGDYTIVYDSFEHKLSDGIIKVGPEIIVRKKNLTNKLWPHNNLYPDGQTTSEIDVHTGLLEDIYVSFDAVTPDGKVIITAKLKPLMFWLWLAAILIIAGPALAMFENRSAKRKAENTELTN